MRRHLVAADQVLGPKPCPNMPAPRRRVLGARRGPSGGSALVTTARATVSQRGDHRVLTPKSACGRVAFGYTQAHRRPPAALEAP